MPDDDRERLIAHLDGSRDMYGDPTDVEPFEGGATFDAGDVELTALHTPGYTAGLTCFVTGDGTVLSIDALFSVYTPNVGGADVRLEIPLDRFFGSPRTIADRGFERAWPGHREPIVDPTERARALLEPRSAPGGSSTCSAASGRPRRGRSAQTCSAPSLASTSSMDPARFPPPRTPRTAGAVERTPEGYRFGDRLPDD
jgi:glyoxylase-like metal-dependent hydrolase (beta-lactamase superfamily II)